MKLEDQCVSLEYAKRLKELGVEQKSVFYWIEDLESEKQPCAIIHYGYVPNINEQYSAFTVAELGEMLPYKYITIKHNGENSADKKDFYYCYWDELGYSSEAQCANTEADARAKMLIYLIEQEYIKVEDINYNATRYTG